MTRYWGIQWTHMLHMNNITKTEMVLKQVWIQTLWEVSTLNHLTMEILEEAMVTTTVAGTVSTSAAICDWILIINQVEAITSSITQVKNISWWASLQITLLAPCKWLKAHQCLLKTTLSPLKRPLTLNTRANQSTCNLPSNLTLYLKALFRTLY